MLGRVNRTAQKSINEYELSDSYCLGLWTQDDSILGIPNAIVCPTACFVREDSQLIVNTDLASIAKGRGGVCKDLYLVSTLGSL